MLVLLFDLVVTWCFIWYYFCLGWLTWLVGFGNRGVVRGVVDYLRYCWLRHVVCVWFLRCGLIVVYCAPGLLGVVGTMLLWVVFMIMVATPRL